MKMDLERLQGTPVTLEPLSGPVARPPLGLGRLGVGALLLVLIVPILPLYWLALSTFAAGRGLAALMREAVVHAAEVTVGRPG